MTCKRTCDLLKQRGYYDDTARYNELCRTNDDAEPLPASATLWGHANDDPIVTCFTNEPCDVGPNDFGVSGIVFRSFDDVVDYGP